MSKLFQYVCVPPTVGRWNTWILKYQTAKEAQQIAIAINLINRSNVPWLPRDVWDIIVRQIITHDLKDGTSRFQNDAVKWVEFWVSDSAQQERNPIILADSPPALEQLYQLCQLGTRQTLIAEETIKSVWIATNAANTRYQVGITRRHDLFLGLTFDDLSNIASCNITIGGTPLKTPFSFSIDTKIFVVSSQKGHRCEYYFNPGLKVIPIVALAYHHIQVEITLNDNTKPPSPVRLLCAFLDGNARFNIARKDHLLGTHPNTFLITNGMGGYFGIKPGMAV